MVRGMLLWPASACVTAASGDSSLKLSKKVVQLLCYCGITYSSSMTGPVFCAQLPAKPAWCDYCPGAPQFTSCIFFQTGSCHIVECLSRPECGVWTYLFKMHFQSVLYSLCPHKLQFPNTCATRQHSHHWSLRHGLQLPWSLVPRGHGRHSPVL